jgi:hypothetical protein
MANVQRHPSNERHTDRFLPLNTRYRASRLVGTGHTADMQSGWVQFLFTIEGWYDTWHMDQPNGIQANFGGSFTGTDISYMRVSRE